MISLCYGEQAKVCFGLGRKLLGFVVSQRGIEVDPDKVKAILEMPPPMLPLNFEGRTA